jgi:ABC-type Fe3+-hydroxamate transport system substrate-binding protein
MGDLFGAEVAAEDMCNRFDAALADLQSAAASARTKNVLYLIWKDPWMTISSDTYISRTLALINWQTVAHDPGNRYPEVDMDTALVDADLVLMSTEPYEFGNKDLAEFRARYPGTPVQMIDGEMTSWYGSRAIAGLAYLKTLTA